MTRKVLMLAGGLAACFALLGALAALVLSPPPIACRLELRYVLESGSPAARGTAADIIRHRLEAGGFRDAAVALDGAGLLVRVPIRQPRGGRASPSRKDPKAGEARLSAETDLVRRLVETGGRLALHKVDACGNPDPAPNVYGGTDYANDPDRWRKALAGEPTPGFLLAEHVSAGPFGESPRAEKLLLAARPMIDDSLIDGAVAEALLHGEGWRVMVYFSAVGNARLRSQTSAARMRHGRDRLAFVLDGKVMMAPVVMSQLGGPFELRWKPARRDAEELANVLNCGSLPCALVLESCRQLPPEAGE